MLKHFPIWLAAACFVCLAGCRDGAWHSAAGESHWGGVPGKLAHLPAPQIPQRSFPITTFGAVAGGETDCTMAIQRAIAAAVEHGGGTVEVPPGDYLTGPIHLRSRVELHLQKGAILKFTTNTDAYLPAVLTRFEGMDCWNYSPLIYAYGQHDIAVTGEGTLDGQASDETWWRWKGRRASGNNQNVARARLNKFVNSKTPVNERRFGAGDFLRPPFIETYRCSHVLIQGVRIRHSPMWEVHPLLSTNVIVRGLDIQSNGPNNDGCDPESCRNVLIEDTVFDTGDDCIAIKSGRNDDGRRVNTPTENVLIRGCTMKAGHGGVTIGSEISGGCRNVFVENCRMDSPDLDRAIRFKSNAVRGGTVEHVYVRNMRVGAVRDAVLQIDFLYEEGASGPYKPVVRDVVLEKMTVARCRRVLDIRGFPGAEISSVRLRDDKFESVAEPDAVSDADVKLLRCEVGR
jgi:polygalacturonase